MGVDSSRLGLSGIRELMARLAWDRMGFVLSEDEMENAELLPLDSGNACSSRRGTEKAVVLLIRFSGKR